MSTARPDLERIQREHELSRAIEAARTLQARLELLDDRAHDVAVVHSLRDSLARDLAGLPARLSDVDPALVEDEGSGDWLADAARNHERDRLENAG